MSKCGVCGTENAEGLCPVCAAYALHDGEGMARAICEKLPEEYGEILAAMFEKLPVEYKGRKFGCISAFTIRTRVSVTHALRVPFIYQVELMSGRGHCVEIANPSEIKILRRPEQ